MQSSLNENPKKAVRNRNARNELIKKIDKKEGDASTKIQSAVRNRNALNETIKRAKQKKMKH